MKGFRQKLKERQEKVGSLVCVGLDPLPEKIPTDCVMERPVWSRIIIQMREIIDAVAPYASMFKPQKAHY